MRKSVSCVCRDRERPPAAAPDRLPWPAVSDILPPACNRNPPGDQGGLSHSIEGIFLFDGIFPALERALSFYIRRYSYGASSRTAASAATRPCSGDRRHTGS